MERDAIEVGDHLVYGYLWCSNWSISTELRANVGGVYPEKRSVRRDCISTFW